jgi:hypothetical protein
VKPIRLWRQWTGEFIYTPELVPLEFTQYAQCDDSDYPWLSQWDWYLIRNDPYRYAHCVLYVSPDECRVETVHRMVMEAYSGPGDRFIGHTDSNNLNNQRSNLHWKKGRRRPPLDLAGGVGVPALGARTNTRWPTIRREEGQKG